MLVLLVMLVRNIFSDILVLCTHFYGGQHIVGGDRLSLVFARKVIGARRQINDKDPRRTGKGGGSILANVRR